MSHIRATVLLQFIVRERCFIRQRIARVRLTQRLPTTCQHVRIRRRHTRVNLALSRKSAHEPSDLGVVHLPFGNLTRPRQFRFLLCSGWIREWDVGIRFAGMTHREGVLTQVDRLCTMQSVLAACRRVAFQ
jgi:hypothetical protein